MFDSVAISSYAGCMLLGESVAGVTDDSGVGRTRGVLAISDPTLFDAVEAMESAWQSVAAVRTSALADADRRAVMVRMETLSRAMYGTSHVWLTELVENDGLAVLPDRTNSSRLASLLRIDPSVAGKRLRIAAKLSERRAMTGETIEPEYPSTAAAHRDGDIDAAHVTVIDEFFKNLPTAVDHESAVQSEILLSDLAKQVAPEQLRVAAARLLALLDPDGSLTDDKDPLSKCYFNLGRQGADGLSKGSFVIDSEFRAYLEAVLAKWAKAGNCNPDEPAPVIDDEVPPSDSTDEPSTDLDLTLFDEPGGAGGEGCGEGCGESWGGGGADGEGCGESCGGGGAGREGCGESCGGGEPGGVSDDGDAGVGEADGGSEGGGESAAHGGVTSADAKRRAGRDMRSQGRRNHDAVKAVLRQMLASGALGKHRGLPVTAIITMTAKELEEASGHAVTGTGSLVPIRDAIRMASHARHYLVIFDDEDGRALYLGRSKRIASADQRVVLIARDRGCTFPACTRPATWCQAHHIDDWVDGGPTDVDALTFGCDLHHPLVGTGPDDWATPTTGPNHPQPGRTQWHPPAAVDPDRGGMVNHYHHPQEFLYDNPDDPDDH